MLNFSCYNQDTMTIIDKAMKTEAILKKDEQRLKLMHKISQLAKKRLNIIEAIIDLDKEYKKHTPFSSFLPLLS